MILDCKFIMPARTGDTKLLALIDSSACVNSRSSPVAKHLGWATKPNNTLATVKLENRTVVNSSGIAIGLALSRVWQAYMTFLVLDVSFEVILGML